MFKSKAADRSFRNQFSKAYKVLYKEGCLCYLTEILDSAQEGFPFLWVNGEKYVFSNEVLDAGTKLFKHFGKIQGTIRDLYECIVDESVEITIEYIMKELAKNLEVFDQTWVSYEQIYVMELMLIEADARLLITEAIETEKQLSAIELREKGRGRIVVDSQAHTAARSKLVQILGKINSVANPEGLGRDDLTNDILLAAEGLFRRISPTQSNAVRNLAQRIKKVFQEFKALLKRYDQNIEVVDPQLKNNQELVDILSEFESSWSQGLTYFMDTTRLSQLLHFSQVIEATVEKHSEFREAVEQRDSEIFLTIPALLILKSLEGEDKDICRLFYPDMYAETLGKSDVVKDLKRLYTKLRRQFGRYELYNLMEKCVIEVKLSAKERELSECLELERLLLKEIRGLAMELSRNNPQEWNKFLDVVIR